MNQTQNQMGDGLYIDECWVVCQKCKLVTDRNATHRSSSPMFEYMEAEN